MFLTDDELIELTGKRMASAQCRALRRMGVRYVVRPDGKPRVAREWLEAWQKIKRPQ